MDSSRPEIEQNQPARRYRFGDFLLDIERYELSRAGSAIRLQPKTFDVLVYLVTHAGRVIEKDELLGAVWAGVVVTENSLTRCIKDLRKALDDDAGQPRYIETVARRGYRLLVIPAILDDSTPPPAQAKPGSPGIDAASPPRVAKRKTALALGALVLIALIAGVVAGLGMRTTRQESASAIAKPAIAVLPFANFSSEPDTQFFADGIAENLLDLLAQMPNLRVLARTSSFAFRTHERDAKSIGQELGVDWLLEGSVRREADNVRVTVQLIDAHTGFHSWSAQYDRKYSGLFAMQDDITRAVVAQVAQRTDSGSPMGITAPTANLDAYQSFMLGRDYLNRRTVGWAEKALQAFDRAIDLDPDFARAHAGKAIIESHLASLDSAPPQQKAVARASAERALQLDPNLALGFAARGFVLMNERTDLPAAEAALRKAQQLDPGYANTYNWLASVLGSLGRRAESIQEMEKGLLVDPLNPVLIENHARTLFRLGRFDASREEYLKSLRLPERRERRYVGLAWLHTAHGQLTEALRYWLLEARATQAGDGSLSLLRGLDVLSRLGFGHVAQRRYRQARSQPLQARQIWDIEAYLCLDGRFREMEDAVKPLVTGHSLSINLRQYLGRSAALQGNAKLAIERLMPTLRDDLPGGMGGWGSDFAHVDSHLALIHALNLAGRRAEAEAEGSRLLGQYRAAAAAGFTKTPGEFYHYALALALSSPRRDDEVFAALEQALMLGWNNFQAAEHDPRWNRLRPDPRFAALMARAAKSVREERAKLDARLAAHDPDFADLER
jgi:TolB-like protein/DNA-binding winged helix-turn-helix (wHTH) protein/Tfp pilus assembly protein PilF